MQHIGVLKDRRVPVICTRFPPSAPFRRYCFELRSDASEKDPKVIGVYTQDMVQRDKLGMYMDPAS
jgi:hypothetical protein